VTPRGRLGSLGTVVLLLVVSLAFGVLRVEADPPSTPSVATARDCLVPGGPIAVVGTGFTPRTKILIFIDQVPAGATLTDTAGTFALDPTDSPSPGAHTLVAMEEGGGNSATTPLAIPCPPRLRLTLDPPIGPPGFVTIARGRGFPPGAQVNLRWVRGLGSVDVTASVDGVFDTPVLIFPGDLLGPRVLVASGTAVGGQVLRSVGARFLVVPGTLSPPRFLDRG
jgi:hypothetical protein